MDYSLSDVRCISLKLRVAQCLCRRSKREYLYPEFSMREKLDSDTTLVPKKQESLPRAEKDVLTGRAASTIPLQAVPRAHVESEGYPSWPPKRSPPLAPGSTLHSLSTAMMLGSDGGAGPTERAQTSNAATTATGTGAGGAGGRLIGSDDDDAGKEQCWCHLPLSLFFFFRYRSLDARLRAAIATLPKFRSPSFHLELLRDVHPFLPISHPRSRTRPLQTFLDFNAIYILIDCKVPESGRTRSSRL
ncbi:hypothetical protein F5888DRAFT_1803269 [Russula emetica]|nr:hypothetical protein F5888DRAFT_1803269 [Russula emetica]